MSIIKEQHPNPYKFITEDEFNEKVDSLRNRLALNPNIYNFQILSPINLIRDVHFQRHLTEDLLLDINKSLSFFPLPVYIEKGQMFVNIKDQDIPFGSEIVSINNKSVKELLKEMSVGLSDGSISSSIDRLSTEFGYKISFLYPHIKSYNIVYTLNKGGEKKEKSLKSLDYSSYYYINDKSVMPYNMLERSTLIYSAMIDEKRTGVLTVNSFSMDESYAYKKFSEFFIEINKKKYDNVIIDIRNNGGGSPNIASLLYSFISKTKFDNVYNYRTKTIDLAYPEYIISNDGLRKYSREDILADKNYMYQRFDKDTVSNFYVGNNRLDESFIRDYPKDKDAFAGNVYILTGSETISAATYFATLVKVNKRGTIVGKETSSGIDATTAVWFLTYQLPETGIYIIVPRSEIFFFNATSDRGRGLIPDKMLETVFFQKNMLKGKDPEMTYVLDLIK